MTDDYSNARCCAIRTNGKRCRGRWNTAAPCTYQWDPVAGVGKGAPYIVLCRYHRRWIWDADGIKSGARFPVVHRGWLGAYNEYGYGTCVLSAPTGWKAAKWWAAHSFPVRFGGSEPRCAP